MRWSIQVLEGVNERGTRGKEIPQEMWREDTGYYLAIDLYKTEPMLEKQEHKNKEKKRGC
jgi:hypothetical protein